MHRLHDRDVTERECGHTLRMRLVDEFRPTARARDAASAFLKYVACSEGTDPMPCPLIEGGILAVSELVTNAWRHGGGAVEMRLGWGECGFRVEVDDLSSIPPTIVPEGSRGSDGGYGLALIDQLAESWGTTSRPFGKTVHAQLVRGSGSGPNSSATAHRSELDTSPTESSRP
ncbi:ATP-binding protein [Streptomyces sp. NPDC051976]|uniref:ATP-binding protein n=1 Tax=Streptomyces sp. NPDC051976 TaxID=3154947 RepID=UPI0034333EA5